jgi:hypothetical protein
MPDEPQLAARVTAAIRTGPAPRVERLPRLLSRPVAVFGTAVLLVAISATLAFSPAARDAVADFLGIGGVRIEVGPSAGPTPTAAPGENLSLGVATSLEDAQERVDFDIRLPNVADLPAAPDSVYYSDFPVGGRVSLVYRARPGSLPETSTTGVGLLLTEFQGSIDGDFAKKLAVDQQAQATEVNGRLAIWVRGPHTVFFLDAEGRPQAESLRLSANALIWVDDGVTFRLESELTLKDSLTIAESMT